VPIGVRTHADSQYFPRHDGGMNVAAEAFSADDETAEHHPMTKAKTRARALQSLAGGPLVVAAYGSWKSPITSNLIARQSIKLSEVRLDGDDIYWLEDRPQENGRCVVVRAPDSSINSEPYSARTEIHTYGGGAWIVDNGTLYFSNFPDGRLYRQDRCPAQPQPITPAPPSPKRNWR
jgi:hypothetical protein